MKNKLKTSSKTPLKFDLNNFNFRVLLMINAGLNPSQISKKLKMSKPLISYYTSKLKRLGLINKIGYGVWELTIKGKKQVKTSSKIPHVGMGLIGGVSKKKLKADSVRGHAFVFKLIIPKLKNWHKRAVFLDNIGFDYKTFNFGQRILINNFKVWLCSKSIVVYFPASFSVFSDVAMSSRENAINVFYGIVKKLESLLKVSLRINKQYCFRVSRQHYSLVKNALAKDLNSRKEKLKCYFNGKLWLLIDDSFNLQELETIHSKTAVSDNKKVQDFFNDIKGLDGYSPKVVLSAIGKNAENLDNYAKYLTAHVQSIKVLGSSVNEFSKRMDLFFKKLEDKKETRPKDKQENN